MKSALVLQPIEMSCRHCGTLFQTRTNQEFCCSGCEFVFAFLKDNGLSDYYRLRNSEPDVCPIPVAPTSETFDFCDDPEFIRDLELDGRKIEFFLENLSCTACLWLLEKLPQICTDAESSRVNMSKSTIEVVRTAIGSFASIARTLNRLGYRPHPVKNRANLEKLQKRESRRDMIRVGVAAAATGNIMILAVSLYAGASGELANEFRWLTALLASPVMTYCAWPFYRSAWSGLRSKHLNIDIPIVAAILSGIIVSIWGLASGAETLYLDSLSMLVFLLLSSRLWLKGVQKHIIDTSHIEDELLLSTVTRIRGDIQRERVSSLSLTPGDIIELTENAFIPVDGTMVFGVGLIDRSVLTGESEPITVENGARLEAGTRTLSGRILLRVDQATRDSRLAQILKDTETSAKAKSNLVVFADTVSQWFIGAVLLSALALFIGFTLYGQTEVGISRALALVIVTCPCVFGMAIPLSMSLAVRAAARRGLIIKNADALERLSKARSIFFDKTGTLTRGELRVVSVSSTLPMPELEKHLSAARALEANQLHPVAKAIMLHADQLELPHVEARGVRMILQGGIEGRVYGAHYALRPLGLAPSDAVMLRRNLKTCYSLDCNGQSVAEIQVGDEVLPEAVDLIQWCRAKGLHLRMISGDQKSVVEACRRLIGFHSNEVTAKATPESKSQALKEAGETSVMIGDGANDAAALAAAGVGIAVRGSLEVSLRAADVYLSGAKLDAIPQVFRIATLTRRAIIRNLVFSASFNLLSGSLAVLGLMTPLWAAVLMPLSSLTVLISALLTGRKLQEGK